MKKWNLLWILIILMPNVMAQGFGHCLFGNYPFGNCVITEEEEGAAPGGGGGAGVFVSQTGVGLLYDVTVSVSPFIYISGDAIKAIITIHNKQGIPTKDAILTYYLSSPSNEKFSEVREVFFPEHKTRQTFTRELKLPEEMEQGQWRIVVVFDPVEEDPIEAFVSFEAVAKGDLSKGGMLSIIIVILISIIAYEKVTNRKKEWEEY